MSARDETGWLLPPRHILVASDLTLAAANAAWRAAQLARAHGASLRLLQVSPRAHDAQAARESLAALAHAMHQRLGVQAEVDVAAGDLAREAARASAGADLLVVPSRDGTTWRERIAGTSTERVVRASRIPVLVVKRPLARARASAPPDPLRGDGHARILACVDLLPASAGVLTAAASLGGQARVDVFHAVSPERTPPAGEGTAVERARAAVQERIAHAGTQQGDPQARVGFGQPGACVLAQERAIGADLVVLGKRHNRFFGDLFLGAVAQEVLSGSRCDVLLVPAPQATALG